MVTGYPIIVSQFYWNRSLAQRELLASRFGFLSFLSLISMVFDHLYPTGDSSMVPEGNRPSCQHPATPVPPLAQPSAAGFFP